jgi:hypothetical protein
MKYFSRYRTIIQFFLAAVFLFVVRALAQTDPTVPAETFNYVFLIPFFFGMLLHFLKKYFESGGDISFVSWYVHNFGWTVGSLIAGWGLLYGAVNGLPLGFQSLLTAFIAGWSGDSLNQNGNSKNGASASISPGGKVVG